MSKLLLAIAILNQVLFTLYFWLENKAHFHSAPKLILKKIARRLDFFNNKIHVIKVLYVWYEFMRL